MTPTPSEMAFDPYPDFELFKLATIFLQKIYFLLCNKKSRCDFDDEL